MRKIMSQALLAILLGVAMVMGGYLLYLYQEIQTLIYPDPPHAICQKGFAYYQIDEDSTVYLKSDHECVDEREVNA